MKMKKVNPKVVAIATLLMTVLVGGTIAAERAIGGAALDGASADNDDTGM